MIMKLNRSHLQRLFGKRKDRRERRRMEKASSCMQKHRKETHHLKAEKKKILELIDYTYWLIDLKLKINVHDDVSEWMNWVSVWWQNRRFRRKRNVQGVEEKNRTGIRSRTEHTKRRGFYDWQIGSFSHIYCRFFTMNSPVGNKVGKSWREREGNIAEDRKLSQFDPVTHF